MEYWEENILYEMRENIQNIYRAFQGVNFFGFDTG